MKTFSGSWVDRLGLLFMGTCGFGAGYFFILLAIQRVLEKDGMSPAILLASIPFGLFGLGLGLVCVYGIAESFTTYRVDDEQIERRGLFGSLTMRWAEVTEIETRGVKNSDIRLRDFKDRRMPLMMGLVHDPRMELRGLINERLADLRARRKQNLEWETKTYHPTRGLSLVLLPVCLAFLGFGLMPFLDTKTISGTETERWIFALIMEGGGVLMGLLCLWGVTNTLTIRRGAITSGSLFGTRSIPMNRIKSVMIQDIRTKSGTINVTTVEGAGQKIRISETTPDYTLIQEYICEQAGPSAVARGKADAPVLQKKQQKQALIFMTLLSLFGLGGFSLYFICGARTNLDRQDQLDRRGLFVIGHITGVSASGGKSTTYYLDYTFTRNGRAYRHSSPVRYADYQAAVPGQKVSITYLPDDPEVCRASQSIKREMATKALYVGYCYLVSAFLFPLLFVWRTVRQARRRPSQSSDNPASPND